MPQCPKCGVSYPDGAKFCPACRHSPASIIRKGLLQQGDTVCLDYEIEELLRTDHNGERYLGAHKLTRQPVTVEVLSPILAENPRAREQVLAEARVLSRFHHPTLPVMYTIREEFRRIWIVFQHPEGTPLSYIISKKNYPSPDAAVRIFEQVLSGLDHTHRQGLFHGALRPSLVFIDAYLNVMIGGFGFLKALDPPQAGIKRDLMTAFYAAPETALGQNADHRTDVYHTGILFFHSVSGRPPFTGKSNYEIIRGHVEERPPDLHSVCPAISPEVSVVIDKALCKNPDDRFQTAGEFREALLQARAKTSKNSLEPTPSNESASPHPMAEPGTSSEVSSLNDEPATKNVSGTLMGLPEEKRPPSGSDGDKTGEKHISPSRNFTGDKSAGQANNETGISGKRRPPGSQRETIKTRPPGPTPVEKSAPEERGKPLKAAPSLKDDDFGQPLKPGLAKDSRANLGRLSLKRITVQGGQSSEKVTPLQTPAVQDVQPQSPEPQSTQQPDEQVEKLRSAEPRPELQPEPRPAQQPEQPGEEKKPADPAPAQQIEHTNNIEHIPDETTNESEVMEPAQPEDSEDSEIMKHESDDEHSFFLSQEPQPPSTVDDFSDLEIPLHHRGSSKGLFINLAIVGLVVLGLGFYLVYTFWLDPYARVEKSQEMMRPPQETKSAETKKPDHAAPIAEEDVTVQKHESEENNDAEVAEMDPPEKPTTSPVPETPPEIKAKVNEAVEIWKKNRKKAVALLEEVIQTHPGHQEARKMLASHYDEGAWRALNRGSWTVSLDLAEKALSYDPSAKKAWFSKGYVNRQRGQNEEAEKAFNAYLNLCKTSKCKMENYAKKYLKSL